MSNYSRKKTYTDKKWSKFNGFPFSFYYVLNLSLARKWNKRGKIMEVNLNECYKIQDLCKFSLQKVTAAVRDSVKVARLLVFYSVDSVHFTLKECT